MKNKSKLALKKIKNVLYSLEENTIDLKLTEENMEASKKEKILQAVSIGSLSSILYLFVYVVRNALSAVAPQMIEDQILTTEIVGKMSSIFFVCYAIGQLVNGVLGDKIKARNMICLGLWFSGISHFLIVYVTDSPVLACALYAITGFFLSMIYAPMTKVIAENVELIYATRCTLGLTFAALFGSPLAGILATVFDWKVVFGISSGVLFIMGFVGFVFYIYYERKGVIVYNRFAAAAKESGSVKVLFKRRIVKFTIVAILTGIIRTSVVFWLPTYISQYLGFSPAKSTIIFTIATTFISLTAFLAMFMYERFNRNMDFTLLLVFAISSISFIGAYLVKQPVLNIVFMISAIMFANCASNLLWSVYCPSLRDTGMVSAATGFLNFTSYMAASISNTIFGNAVSVVGWGNLILIWFVLMVVGTVNMFPFRAKKH